ncbi:Holliday junction branch migration protein RuvA [Lederbergia lenta]|uniref:Holliday junction branch migration complex subunit RuvA n=1 Tax=Lederbergia lenta TaxID=1467 RepID=A0A2X4VU99_LEDLE|nr:Holliday junction branch migration protein RuvA [Lederbergia lenta]MCM3111291.1 Holliday junction branch migration protein RuvA [Lederbergia lenta]MEC2325320.1 Holliday junction branch migration protein RuvA [Lederbergia lenta]SQI55817.1 holliday junction DNA helicase RuvA [Lederbergia lenta]
MYEYIKGTVEHIGPEYVVIDNSGVGFQILTPNPFVFSTKKGNEIIIYTYQHVREDILALYGFESMEEKMMFRKLIGVSGIGPKGAMAILAFGEPIQVIQAIENEDEKFLTKFPGVGKKTARQMILDLKGKLHDVVPQSVPDLFTETLPDEQQIDSAANRELEDALLALAALGYSERELKRLEPKLKGEETTTDQYIKRALKLLIK